jgi:hypothetical protein
MASLMLNVGEPVLWSDLDTWRQMRADVSLLGRLSRAKDWIRLCSAEHKKHESCSRNRSRLLPKRVLDLRKFQKQE